MELLRAADWFGRVAIYHTQDENVPRASPKARRWSCPVGVNRAILTVRRSLPLYPDKQTISDWGGTSHLCQYAK